MIPVRRAGAALYAAVLACLIAVPAQADPGRVSPLLRHLTHPQLNGAFRAPTHPDLLPGVAGAAAEPGLRAWVQGTVTREELEALGVRVRTQAGPVFTVDLPPARLLDVAGLPGVVRIEPARRFEPDLDVALVEAQLRTQVHGAAVPSYPGNTGAGVLLGAVDSGVDYQHPDFVDSLGNTRFDSFWDQTNPSGPPPPGYFTGTLHGQAALDSGVPVIANPTGHGTHVQGILGGSGAATGNGEPAYQYTGVAPGATMIGVKTTFWDTDIIDGVDWIFERAAVLGMDAVVNLSLGSQGGPHDGTDPFEIGLDALTGPGRIVVTSASNDRNKDIHARGTVKPAGPPNNIAFTFEIPPYTPAPGADNDVVAMNGWYAGSDDYTVTVNGPGTGTLTVTKGNVGVLHTPDGSIQIENGVSNPVNGDTEVFVFIYDAFAPTPPASGGWDVRFQRVVSTESNIDVWIYASTMAADAYFTGGVSEDVTIGTPATAAEIIAVAAYTTKIAWSSVNGSNYQYSGFPVLGDYAPFSGRGPTRTGAAKPDIAAPGFGVVAALSSDATTSEVYVVPDGVHAIKSGTSMASPMVAGMVALILAKEPGLTPAQVKTRLASSALTDGFTGVVPNPDWGAGKLGGAAADITPPVVHLLAPVGGGTVDAGDTLVVQWNATDNFAVSGVDLAYSTDGGATFPHPIAAGHPNTGSYDWTVPASAGGDYRVRVTAFDACGTATADSSDSSFTVVVPDTIPPAVQVEYPDGGETLAVGAPIQIQWTAQDSSGVDSIAVAFSPDAGQAWFELVSGWPNTGSFDWMLPDSTTDSALVRVTAWDGAGNSASDTSDEVFSIQTTTGIADGARPVLTLAQSRPNPMRAGRTEIGFSIPRDATVGLAVFDAAGRRVADLASGTYPAGAHRVFWDGRRDDGAPAAAGIYFYRLRTPDGTRSRKLMLIR